MKNTIYKSFQISLEEIYVEGGFEYYFKVKYPYDAKFAQDENEQDIVFESEDEATAFIDGIYNFAHREGINLTEYIKNTNNI